jgi:hypothetical protein
MIALSPLLLSGAEEREVRLLQGGIRLAALFTSAGELWWHRNFIREKTALCILCTRSASCANQPEVIMAEHKQISLEVFCTSDQFLHFWMSSNPKTNITIVTFFSKFL